MEKEELDFIKRELALAAKEYSNGEYNPCYECTIPYGKSVEKKTQYKCKACDRVSSCGRRQCVPRMTLENGDFHYCPECNELNCIDCPDSCKVCNAAACSKCMIYCQGCNFYVCAHHMDDCDGSCISCRTKKKVKR